MKYSPYRHNFCLFVNGEVNHVGIFPDRETMNFLVTNLKEWIRFKRFKMFFYLSVKFLSETLRLLIIPCNSLLDIEMRFLFNLDFKSHLFELEIVFHLVPVQ